MDEKELVWKWRNHDSIRRWMYNTSPFSLEHHLEFLENLEKNPTNYFLVRRENIPIGVFSVKEMEDYCVDLGLYISPEHQKKKLSVEFLFLVLTYIFETSAFKRIICAYLIENSAINSLIGLFGFGSRTETKIENRETKSYYFSELNSEKWFKEVKTNKNILRRIRMNNI
jgi:UDP-4-amino-4,6-dideoxy-N-acetyl-beta-L-altrosamine N-acetyltransferase